MIAKPLIDRFRAGPKRATSNKNETEAIISLFQSVNRISSNELAPKKLADVIFRAFETSSIIVSSIASGTLKIEEIWHNPEESAISITDLINKPASALCNQTSQLKQILTINEVSPEQSSGPALRKLQCQSFNGFPIFNKDNEVIAIVSLIDRKRKEYSDTDRKLIQSIADRISRELRNNKQLQGSNETLSDADEDTQLKVELEIANKSLESLSYTISHDLRAPLRSMDSFSKLLVEDYATELPEEAHNHLSRIRRAAKRMGNMIDDLLWLSKVTRRKLEKQQMDMSKMANNALNDILEKHSEYRCEFHSEPHLLINADKHLMKIALQHLLGNACKFSRNRDMININLTHFAKDDETVYKLSDNGCGFDMNYYDQLFDPFKKLHDGEYEGTGIGMATVKRIIQRHGGKVWADSELDEGTSVFFTLGKEAEAA